MATYMTSARVCSLKPNRRDHVDDAARPVGADRQHRGGTAEDEHDDLGGLVVVVSTSGAAMRVAARR